MAAKKPKGHKKSCRCPFCKRAKKGSSKRKASKKGASKRSGAKHGTKKRATAQTFLTGFHDGQSDVRSRKPLRRAKGRADYARGYREGVRTARGAK